MAPEMITAIRSVAILVLGAMAGVGLISKDMATYLASPEVWSAVGLIGGAAVAVWAVVANRPKARVADVVAREPDAVATKLMQTNPHAAVAAVANSPTIDKIVADPYTAQSVPNTKVVSKTVV